MEDSIKDIIFQNFTYCKDFKDRIHNVMICEFDTLGLPKLLEEKYPDSVYFAQVKFATVLFLIFIVILLFFKDIKLFH
jgi:hypothetical protein